MKIFTSEIMAKISKEMTVKIIKMVKITIQWAEELRIIRVISEILSKQWECFGSTKMWSPSKAVALDGTVVTDQHTQRILQDKWWRSETCPITRTGTERVFSSKETKIVRRPPAKQKRSTLHTGNREIRGKNLMLQGFIKTDGSRKFVKIDGILKS